MLKTNQLFKIPSLLKLRVFLFVCAFGWLSVRGQLRPPFEFKHFQEKEGLSHNFVNCFLKDKDGFLWVGTYDGLNCFDGRHFVNFSKQKETQKGLVNNIIHALTEDKAGNIWYATEGGIGYYNKKTHQFENFQKALDFPLFHVLTIHCDRSGDIWFSAVMGLFCYHSKTKTFEVFVHDPARLSSPLKAYIQKNGLLEDSVRHGIWLSTDQGLMYMDIKTKTFIHHQHNPLNKPIFDSQPTSALASYASGQMMVANERNQIVRYDTQTGQVVDQILITHPQVNPYRRGISMIFVDAQRNIWVSTQAYVLFFVEAKTKRMVPFEHNDKEPNSVASSFFSAAYQDQNGTILLGTSNGISYTNLVGPLFFIHPILNASDQLSSEVNFISFYEHSDEWWLGTNHRVVFNYNPTSQQLQKILNTNGQVWEIRKVGNVYYMVLGSAGLMSYVPQKGYSQTIALPEQVQKASPMVLNAEVQNDSLLWLSGFGRYIMRYHTHSQRFEVFDLFQNYPNKAVELLEIHLKIDRNGDIWVLTGLLGIYKFSPQKQQFLLVDNSQSLNFETLYTKATVDANNVFWVPNRNQGLFRFDPRQKTYQLWNKSDGLASDFCTTTEVDNYGNIWIGASHKVSVFNSSSNTFQNFTLPLEGLQPVGVNKLYKLKNGNIVYLLKHTIVEFFTERIHRNVLTTKPLMSYIQLPNSKGYCLAGKTHLSLEVEQNNFTITYGYLPLSLNDAYQYTYQLEGFEKTWHKDDRTGSATYSNLPGGDYIFKVKAMNGSSVSKEAVMHIHIATVFYKTWWFIGLFLTGLLWLVYSFYRYRVSQTARIHHMQLQTTTLQKEKSEIQYQNLINHLNPHFLFNSLTSLNSLIITEPKQASKFLQKLSAIYRYILQSKEKETVSLEQELNFVKNYVELQKARFEEGLQISVEVDDAYLGHGIVPVTLQNLFENAIKHNSIEDERPLKIEVYVEDNYLIVKNNLQKKGFVETSNKQGLDSLKKLYEYLTSRPLEANETATHFMVKVPLI